MLPTLERSRRFPIDRSGDRFIALAAIMVSLTLLVAALASLALPAPVRRGLWLPIHLALAGGASTAIAGVLPFFVSAFAAAPPARILLRAAGVGAVSLGAVGVAAGVVGEAALLAVVGGVSFVVGIGLVALAVLRPLASALGPSRGMVTQAYLAALGMVAVGAIVATLYVASWRPIVEAWARLRPAHAWLNLVGFVSLVIATTLIHFFPTVVGARIGGHRSGRAMVAALATAPALVATGYVLGFGAPVQLGGALAIVGAGALVMYAVHVWGRRARWTTDPGWHVFAIGGLASAIGWFMVGMAILGGRAILSHDGPSGWALEAVVGPLVVGWVGLAILASATHLVPAVGPGNQAAHARQRGVLGRAAGLRLIALNTGVAGISVGLPFGWSEVAVASAAILTAALLLTVGLLARAVSIGLAAGLGR